MAQPPQHDADGPTFSSLLLPFSLWLLQDGATEGERRRNSTGLKLAVGNAAQMGPASMP